MWGIWLTFSDDTLDRAEFCGFYFYPQLGRKSNRMLLWLAIVMSAASQV